MIRIEEIRELSRRVELELVPYAAEEFRLAKRTGFNVISSSIKAWVLWHNERPLLVCGLTRQAMLGNAFFWFMLCNGFRPRYARELRALLGVMPTLSGVQPPFMTFIEEGFTAACRFAKFFGFEPTGEHRADFGRRYEVYRVR